MYPSPLLFLIFFPFRLSFFFFFLVSFLSGKFGNICDRILQLMILHAYKQKSEGNERLDDHYVIFLGGSNKGVESIILQPILRVRGSNLLRES